MDLESVARAISKLLTIINDLLQNLTDNNDSHKLKILLELSVFNIKSIQENLKSNLKEHRNDISSIDDDDDDANIENEDYETTNIENDEEVSVDDNYVMKDQDVKLDSYSSNKELEIGEQEEAEEEAKPVSIKIPQETEVLDEKFCKTCDRHYKSRLTLRRHWRWRHQKEQEKAEEAKPGNIKISPEIEVPDGKFCSICDRPYKSRFTFKRHWRKRHTKEGLRSFMRHFCTECDEGFRQRPNLLKHIRREHWLSHLSILCTLCNLKFKTKADLQTHTMKAHPKRLGIRKCTLCGENFFQKEEFDHHFEENHMENGLFVCSYKNEYECKYSAIEKREFLKHVIVLHTFQAYVTCDRCPQESDVYCTSFSDFKIHYKYFHQDNISSLQKCPKCDKDISDLNVQKYRERRHFQSHTELKFQCQICDKEFAYGKLLEGHYKNRHNKKQRIPCEICGSEVHPKRYKLHVELHNATERTFQCTQCEKMFFTEDQRDKHEYNVHREFSHLCSICSKAFKKIHQLERHLTSHSDERNSPCPQCNTVLKTPWTLAQHIKKVHCDYSFACDQCDKRFKTSGHLKRHNMLHTGERPYTCKICNKGFIQSGNYKLHIKSAHSLQ